MKRNRNTFSPAAASSLLTQADDLVPVVAVFKLDGNSPAATRNTPSPVNAAGSKGKLTFRYSKSIAAKSVAVRSVAAKPAFLPKYTLLPNPEKMANATFGGGDDWTTF